MGLKQFHLFLAALIIIFLSGCSQKTRQVAVTEEGAECRVRLAAVGDITLSEQLLRCAAQSDGSYDFTPAFSAVAGELTGADLAVANLEGNFCGTPYDAAACNYPEALAAALKNAGFDVIQTANTFSMQNGLTGLQSTAEVLSSAGLDYLGTFPSQEDRDNSPVLVREINGVKIAMIAFTKGVNNVRLPEGTEYCVNLLYSDYDSNYSQVDTETITACVAQAKAQKPDVIIAMVHWGSEYDSSISTSQEKIENLLFYNGVDVILGSHSHLVSKLSQKEITDKDGNRKNVFVAYSLGNFYSEEDSSSALESLILNLEFTKYDDGTTQITDAAYTPIYIADNGEEAAYRFTVIHVRNAIELYKNNYYDRVSDELYEKLLKVPEDLKERTESDLEQK